MIESDRRAQDRYVYEGWSGAGRKQLRRVVVCVCALVAAGCDVSSSGSSLVRPTPTPVATPTPLADIRISGQVIDDSDRPVASARIIAANLWSGFVGGVDSASDGTFEFRVGGWSRGTVVSVEKDGFEPSYVELSWPNAQPGDMVVTDLRLHAIVRISAGESATLAIVDRRVWCTYDSESYPACRSLRVRSEHAGRLIMETHAPFLLVLDGGTASEQLIVDLDTAREVIVNVVLLDPAPREATIATRLEVR